MMAAKRKSVNLRSIALLILLAVILAAAGYFVVHRTGQNTISPSESSVTALPSGARQTPSPASAKQSAVGAVAPQSSASQSGATPVESTDGGNTAAYPLHDSDTAISRCTYIPDAKCNITFTSETGGQVKSLTSQTIPANGTASWTWDGSLLSAGAWKVQAVGIIGGIQKVSNTEVIYVKE